MSRTTSGEPAGRPLAADGDWLTVARLLGGLLLLYYLAPLLALLLRGAPLAVARIGDQEIAAAAVVSVVASTLSAGVATVLGVPLAYWLARTESNAETAVTAVVILPLVLPPVASGMLLLSVFGPNAPLGAAADAAGFPLTGSLAGIVLAQTFVASPFVVVTAKAAFEGVDRRLEQASRTLGTGRATTFRRVTGPLALPGIVAGITLAFARAMGEFGATLMLAYHPRTMPVQIWVSFSTRGLDAAFPIAVLLVVVSLAAIVALTALGSNPWR